MSNISYEPFGPYSALTFGNGVAETRGFDQDYRPTTLTDTGTSPLQNVSYAYYPTNNLQTITDAVNSGNSQSFNYDNLQRLNQATGAYGAFAFTYDSDGNRSSQTLGTTMTTYGYGVANDLLQSLSVGGVQTQSIGYTADGRMANLNPGVQAPGGQVITSLSYNQDAQLSAVNAAGGTLATYTYDGFGQRLNKTVPPAYGEIYQYGQNGLLLEETNASGVALADYIYLDGRPIATFNNSTGTLYFLHDDLLGTPQLATDAGQTTVWQAAYQPFGQASVSGMITQNLRFPGQHFDIESGWNHNGFRNYLPDLGRYAEPDPLAASAGYYDPQTGRFLNEGLLGVGGIGPNLYNYGDDSPTNFIDPSGGSDFRVYGKWCGPGWTGGRWEAYDPTHDHDIRTYHHRSGVGRTPYYANRIDDLDAACEVHDKCYYNCRANYKCDKKARKGCMSQCNKTLADSAWNAGISGGALDAEWEVTAAMKYKSPSDDLVGENDPSCKCKK